MKKKFVCIFLGLCLLIAGCGYSLGSLLPPHIKTVYVKDFNNKTYERNLETDIVDKIKERYNWNGNLKVVNSKEEADSMLEGEVVDYMRQPARYSDADDKTVDEYKLILKVDLTYTDLVKNSVMWTETNFAGEAYYVVSGTFATTETRVRANSEEEALRFAAEDLAQNIVDRTIEGW